MVRQMRVLDLHLSSVLSALKPRFKAYKTENLSEIINRRLA